METAAGVKLSPEHLQALLLQHKYLAAVRRVARGVAHGYNNIFTGLSGQIAMLQQEIAALTDLSSKRNELVGDLLRRGIEQTAILSGIAREADADSRSHFPLVPAAKALELLNCISRVHRFELISRIQHEKVVCNPRDIVLLLFYLGENCVDATPEGGSVVLEVCREETKPGQDPELAFRFRDRGPGLPEGIQARLGEPFVTGRGPSPDRGGLGLYSALILAGRNKGRTTHSRSAAGETVAGAIFPLAAEEPRARPSGPDTVKKESRTRNEHIKQCFLVVEDDEAMRTLLLNRLQRRGHMVFCVHTCAEAMEEYALLHEIITTVLMDVGLRDDSGYECSRKIVGINPRARIIFMSGDEAMIPKEISGNSVFLQKPFTLDQLEKAVRDVHI